MAINGFDPLTVEAIAAEQAAKVAMPDMTKALKQPERLYSVRPRSDILGQRGSTLDRGFRSRLKLKTVDPKRSKEIHTQKDTFSSITSGSQIMDSLLSDYGWTDFMLQNVRVSYSEKVQITQTFGDTDVVYYFGKAPVIYDISGMLFDDIDNQWFTSFLETYTQVLRGTQLAQNYELVTLELPNMIITGSISSCGYQQDATRDTDIPFNISIIAKTVTMIPVNPTKFYIDSANNKLDMTKSQALTGVPTQKTINLIKNGQAAPKQAGVGLGGITGAGGSGNTTLDSFRSSLFSPVYGILASVTRVIKDTTGQVSSIISSFTNPVKTILRDIQGISSQAIAVAKLVENSVNQIISIPNSVLTEINTTLSVLKNTKGVISRVPENISQSIARLVQSGNLKGTAAFLSGSRGNSSKAALLSSGKPYTPQRGARL